MATIDTKAAWTEIKIHWTNVGKPDMWIGMYKNAGTPEYHWDNEGISSVKRGMSPAEMQWYNGATWEKEPMDAVGWFLTKKQEPNALWPSWLHNEYIVMCETCFNYKTQ